MESSKNSIDNTRPQNLGPKDFGGDSGGVTPVPIPNTVVKPTSADGTWDECPRESRSPPDFEKKAADPMGPLLYFWRMSNSFCKWAVGFIRYGSF